MSDISGLIRDFLEARRFSQVFRGVLQHIRVLRSVSTIISSREHLCCVLTTHIINSIIITISTIIILIILIIITTLIMIIILTVMMMPRCEVHQGVEAEVQCRAHRGGTGDPAARFPQHHNHTSYDDNLQHMEKRNLQQVSSALQ